MSAYSTNSVTLAYGATSQTFAALFADDENYELIRLVKQRIDWTILETILGFRNLYNVRIQSITSAQRDFLYQFIQSSAQSVTINGSSHDVFLRDERMILDLLGGYIGNLVLNLEFEDQTLTVPSTPSRSQGVTTGSAGYSNTTPGSGSIVTLYYDYGSGRTGRTFRVNRVDSFSADILDKRWMYVDYNNGYKRLGYRSIVNIDFGGFGLGQTQSQLADDRAWIKEFILAPSKSIEVFGQYQCEVVNDFDGVKYGYIGGNIYNKTVSLRFKARNLSTNNPLASATQFILDSPTSGILDSNVLG